MAPRGRNRAENENECQYRKAPAKGLTAPSQGPRLRGRLLASGGDWLLAAPDGSARLDVRGTLERRREIRGP
jgi:hypothetical protein